MSQRSYTRKAQTSQPKKSQTATGKISLTPPRFNRQDYEEYTRLMKELDIGIPILKPCPTVLTNSAVIGDVGYMKDGEFFKVRNIADMKHTVPQCEWKNYSSKEGQSGGIQAIGPGTIDWALESIPTVDKDALKNTELIIRQGTVKAMSSGVALFPLHPFQLESMEQKGKDDLESLMKGQVERWSRETGLATNDLLLVHSRIMSAAWVMMRSKDNIQQKFDVTIDKKELRITFHEPSQPDFACEWGIDALALRQSAKSGASVKQEPSDKISPIRTSNCVFLGAFRMSGRDVLDTAKTLVITKANVSTQPASTEVKKADVGNSGREDGEGGSKATETPPKGSAKGPSTT